MVVTHMGSPPYRAGEGWLSQRPSAWRDRPVPPEPKGSPRCPPKDMGLEVRREELPHKEKEVNSLSSPSQHPPPRSAVGVPSSPGLRRLPRPCPLSPGCPGT